MSKCEVISDPYFPVFGLNTGIYGVNLRIQSEYRKMLIRNNSVFRHFSRSLIYTFVYISIMVMRTWRLKICLSLFKVVQKQSQPSLIWRIQKKLKWKLKLYYWRQPWKWKRAMKCSFLVVIKFRKTYNKLCLIFLYSSNINKHCRLHTYLGRIIDTKKKNRFSH